MRRTQTLGLTLLAAAAGLACSLPAQAQGSRAQQQVELARSACKHSFADARCAVFQNRLIKTVAVEATATSRISFREVSNRQLDALIATVN